MNDATPKFNGNYATPDYITYAKKFPPKKYKDIFKIEKIGITFEDKLAQPPRWVELAEKINEIIDLLSNKI